MVRGQEGGAGANSEKEPATSEKGGNSKQTKSPAGKSGREISREIGKKKEKKGRKSQRQYYGPKKKKKKKSGDFSPSAGGVGGGGGNAKSSCSIWGRNWGEKGKTPSFLPEELRGGGTQD